MYYVLLVNGKVQENIPEYSPIFPGAPIKKRYAPGFLARCVKWDTEVPQGWIYDTEGKKFYAPPKPENELSTDQTLE